MPPSPAQHQPDRGSLELRLFGMSSVLLIGQALQFPVKKSLALLAFLALEGATTRSRLAGLFWSENDDESARRNLRRELHRLREAGLRGWLSSDGERVGLIEPVTCDVHDFEDALEAGNLDRALELHRGELLEGLEIHGAAGFHGWLESYRDRVQQARRRATLELAERFEIRGDWRAALGLHLGSLAEDELQERSHRDVMRLHYLLGERETALEQFDHCRATLEMELGLEPLPETVQLAERIRSARPLEVVNRPTAVVIGRLSAPLVGREQELATLRDSGSPLTLVSGEPGVGKTRLVAEFLGAFPASLTVRFSQALRDTPLYAPAEAIRTAYGEPAIRARLDALEPVWRREVARLVPEVDPGNAPESTEDVDAQPERRTRFLEGLSRALTAVAGLGGAIAFDDLHWADETSLDLVTHAVRRAASRGGTPLRLIATARAQELAENAHASRALTLLEKEGLVQRTKLEPLEETAVLTLVRAMSGSQEGLLFARRLRQATAGNPFFVLETIRYLFETGDLNLALGGGWSTPYDQTTADYAELPIPPSVRQAVLERVDHLGPAARRLLEAAALSEDGFTLEEVQPATALSEWEGLEGLERAVNSSVIERLEIGYRFRHDLARTALDGSLSPERRRLIHGKLAGTLETLNGAPARIATHLERAARSPEAVPWRIRAAEEAVRLFAYPEAVEHYRKAIDDGPDERLAFDLHASRLNLLHFLDEPKLVPPALEAIAAVADRLSDPVLQHEVQLIHARFEQERGHFATALELSEGVLGRDPGPDQRARALYQSGAALLRQGQLPRADERLREALEATTEPSALRARSLIARCQIAARLGDLDRARDQAERALKVFLDLGDRPGEAEARQGLGLVAAMEGDLDLARSHFERGLEITRRIGEVRFQRTLLMNLVMTHLNLHELGPAGNYLEDLSQLPQESLDPQSKYQFHYYAGHHARLSGQLGAALEHFSAQVRLTDQTENPKARIVSRIGLAGILRFCGAFDAALSELDAAWQIVEESRLRENRLEIQLERIRCRLALDRPALAQIEQWVASELPKDAEDSQFLSLVLAESRLAHGDPTGALQRLGDLEPVPQMRTEYLKLRVLIAGGAGSLEPQLVGEVVRLLQGDVLPPLEAFELSRTLVQMLEATGERRQVRVRRHDLACQVRVMAQTLAEHPERQASFLGRNRDLLS